MRNPKLTVYSIGHSNHPLDKFIGLLKKHRISLVCDVRSAPYSRRNPHFNREMLAKSLNNEQIGYAFLGKELGAKSRDQSCYVDGKVQYSLLAKTPLFKSGLDRLISEAESRRLTLMCAEENPLNCHRTILVCRHLRAQVSNILHIRGDSELETHEHFEQRLIGLTGATQGELFSNSENMVEQAYDNRGKDMAYSR